MSETSTGLIMGLTFILLPVVLDDKGIEQVTQKVLYSWVHHQIHHLQTGAFQDLGGVGPSVAHFVLI